MPLILIVEDDDIIRESIGALLEIEGYDVEEAVNGRDALSRIERRPAVPCMILLDIMMPVMDGFEFRRYQLEDPRIADVPVVVISGRADLDQCSDLGRLRVIRKPFQVATVLKLVEQHCPLGI